MFYRKTIIDETARIRVNNPDDSIFITLICNQNWLNNHGRYVNTFDVLEGAEKAQELLYDDCGNV
jgi:hypothetical protein